MSKMDRKAFEAYQENAERQPKYRIPDNFWMDWFNKGYSQAIDDVKSLIENHDEEVYIGVVEDILKLKK